MDKTIKLFYLLLDWIFWMHGSHFYGIHHSKMLNFNFQFVL